MNLMDVWGAKSIVYLIALLSDQIYYWYLRCNIIKITLDERMVHNEILYFSDTWLYVICRENRR